jgi:hypothetical protein
MATVCETNLAKTCPLDLVEQIVAANDWVFDRPSDEEIAMQIPGRWCEYEVFCAWSAGEEAIHLMLALDIRVPKERRAAVHELLALVNDKLWLGHFALWAEENLVVYRNGLPLRGASGPSPEQIEDLIATAIDECERFYPAFQYVIWAGRPPAEAVQAALIETVGQA